MKPLRTNCFFPCLLSKCTPSFRLSALLYVSVLRQDVDSEGYTIRGDDDNGAKGRAIPSIQHNVLPNILRSTMVLYRFL